MLHIKIIPDQVCARREHDLFNARALPLLASSFTSYNPMNSSPSSQPLTQTKPPTGSQVQQTASNSTYSPFSYVLPHPVSFNYPPPPPSNSSTVDRTSKRSLPSKISKRPRLTAHLRSEILKLKAAKPTVFVWEIQQNLLLNGICTAQTLPSVSDLFSARLASLLSHFRPWSFNEFSANRSSHRHRYRRPKPHP